MKKDQKKQRNVYTSHEHLVSHLLVPNIGLADHLPVFICRKYTKKRKETNIIKIKYRDMKNMNTNELLASLNRLYLMGRMLHSRQYQQHSQCFSRYSKHSSKRSVLNDSISPPG